MFVARRRRRDGIDDLIRRDIGIMQGAQGGDAEASKASTSRSMIGQLRHLWEHGMSKSQTEKMKTARNAVVFGVASFFIVKFGDLLAI